MLVRHRETEPIVDPLAYVASTAVVAGAVRIAAGTRILHGAVVTAEDGEVTIGENTVVMEHALIRGRAGHPAAIGSAVMIGPNAHVNGSTVEDEAFLPPARRCSQEAASAPEPRYVSTASSRSTP